MPTVSIVVPNYNYARFLDQRLGSIERQTYKDFEVILLDDASTDESVLTLEKFARRNSWRLIINQSNSGSPFKQWNKGLRLTTGKYVWIAEADDFADERFLEILVDRLDQNPRCGLAYTGSTRVDADGKRLARVLPKIYDVDRNRWRHDFIANGREECFRVLLRENTIQNASAVLFRRELYDVVGGVDEELSLNADWKFWASLLFNSDVAFVAEPLNSFRFHRNTVRSRTKKWGTVVQSMEVMKFIVNSIDVPIDAMQDLHARLAVILVGAWFTKMPSSTELARVRQLTADLEFGFSLRATKGFSRHAIQLIKQRFATGTELTSREH
jgi:glycosyltransferase involved in cell wall biosynthesis